MKCLLLPSSSEAGVPRDAPVDQLFPPPKVDLCDPESVPAMRIVCGEFADGSANAHGLRSATALVAGMASGHQTYEEFEKRMAEYATALEKLPFQYLAFSAPHSGGRHRASLGDGAQRLYGMFGEIIVIIPLSVPVQFSSVTPVEFLKTAVESLRAVGMPDLQVRLPHWGVRLPAGSVYGPHYSSKLKGPRLDLGKEIRERQIAAHVAQLKSKLATLEDGAAALQAQIDGVRGQIQNPVLPPNSQRKAF